MDREGSGGKKRKYGRGREEKGVEEREEERGGEKR